MNILPSILFMGTPEFAAVALNGLLEAGFNVASVVCRPDEKSGRGGLLTPPATKLEAIKHGLPVYQPGNKAELTEIVARLNPELIVVAAYGMIVPQAVLDIPKYGVLNIHGSLLPKYRGASPITEAILNGDKETGITIMKMSLGMDEGGIISQYKIPIILPVISTEVEKSRPLDVARDDSEEYDTTETLTNKMAKLGAKAIVETIPDWVAGKLTGISQNNTDATYCRKITKEDGHIDWAKPAVQIERMVRAYQPWPTAYTFVNGIRLKILKAAVSPSRYCREGGNLELEGGHIYVATGDGTLRIIELQPEGKNPMLARDFINGNKYLARTKLI
jgi:methionyl-tRNA formyltransferase